MDYYESVGSDSLIALLLAAAIPVPFTGLIKDSVYVNSIRIIGCSSSLTVN